MKRLLQKQFTAFTWYALVILVCSIPAYYLLVDRIWLNELDEHNLIESKRIEHSLQQLSGDSAAFNQGLLLWNKLHPYNRIALVEQARSDSTYTVTREDKRVRGSEVDRFRGLSTFIKIDHKVYHLSVETNVEETEETMAAIALVTFIFFLLLLGGFLLLNRRMAKKIWQPFYQTLSQLKAFDLKNRNTVLQLEASDILEFEELNQSIQTLVGNNISTFNEQREFTENASHELQTPLAVMQSKIDMLLQVPSLSQEQNAGLEEINKALKRAHRINKNLLLLAKIGNQQFVTQERVILRELLNETLAFYEEQASLKQITIVTHLSDDIEVTSNKVLTEILLNNLVWNAVRHTAEGGQIRIGLMDGTLSVSNTATYPLNPDTLFKRFISASPNSPGSGLGLAIVMQICIRYGWQVSYSYQQNWHRFQVQFNDHR